jgi:hypothetical protein
MYSKQMNLEHGRRDMKRIAIYARVSTSGQTTSNQLRELQAVAERNSWTVVAEFVDEGISGAKGRDKRPALDKLLRGVTRREFDVVMAWSVDRLGRSLVDLLGTLGELHAKGVDLYRHWIPARVFVRRLADAAVDPQEILLHVAAAWLYARRRPETYDGRAAYIPVLGRAMLRCKPLNEKKFGRLSKRAVTEAGTELFNALCGFLVRVENACNRHKEIHRDLQETLRIPFELLSKGDLAAIKTIAPQLLMAIQDGTLLPEEFESIRANTGGDT